MERFLITLKREHGGRILGIDEHVAEEWGRVMARSKMMGCPVGVPDALIAATALRHGLKLVTRNVKDFEPTGVAVLDPWGSGSSSPTV